MFLYFLPYEIAAGASALAILATLVAFAHYVRSAEDNVQHNVLTVIASE